MINKFFRILNAAFLSNYFIKTNLKGCLHDTVSNFLCVLPFIYMSTVFWGHENTNFENHTIIISV